MWILPTHIGDLINQCVFFVNMRLFFFHKTNKREMVEYIIPTLDAVASIEAKMDAYVAKPDFDGDQYE